MIEVEEVKEKQIEVNVNFNVTIDQRFLDEFKRIIDHHLDYFLDLARFQEIKRIYGAQANLINTPECRQNYIILNKDNTGVFVDNEYEKALKYAKKR